MATTTTTDPRAPLVPLPVAEALARVYTTPRNHNGGRDGDALMRGYESNELNRLNIRRNRECPSRPARWHKSLAAWVAERWPDAPAAEAA